MLFDTSDPRNKPAAHMNGYLGEDGKNPREFLAQATQQLEKYDVKPREELVLSVSGESGNFLVKTEKNEYRAKNIILASGVKDRLPDIPRIADFFGKSAVHCVFCHGYELRDQPIVIYATDPVMALHTVLMFTQISDQLTVITDPSIEFDEVQLQQLAANQVPVFSGPIVQLVGSNGELESVITGDQEIQAKGLVVGLVSEPRLDYLHEKPEMTLQPFGHQVVVDPMGKTSIPGIFAVGNIANLAAPVQIAAASGGMAAGAISSQLIQEEQARLLSH